MAKIGVRLKLDVTKIDKARLFRGQKGTYLDCTAFIDLDQQGQYGDNGMVTQDVSKEEREQGVKGAILGNVTVFYREDGQSDQQGYQQQQQYRQQPPQQNFQHAQAQYAQQQGQAQGQPQQAGGFDDFDSEIPF